VVNQPDQDRSTQGGEAVGALRLRSERPPVMRLSRRALTGLVGVGAVVVSGALIWALYQGNRRMGGGPELYNTETKVTPDGLSALPRDYAGLPQDKPSQGIPQLVGQPVPSDIGRPVVSPQMLGTVDPEQQRIAQENEAARTSRLFATTSTKERPATAASAAPAADQRTALAGQSEVAPLDPGALLNMQDRKVAFVNGAVDRKTVSPDRLENPASRYVVQAGSVIPAALPSCSCTAIPRRRTCGATCCRTCSH
jgi:type IV secretion system protein TrbI